MNVAIVLDRHLDRPCRTGFYAAPAAHAAHRPKVLRIVSELAEEAVAQALALLGAWAVLGLLGFSAQTRLPPARRAREDFVPGAGSSS